MTESTLLHELVARSAERSPEAPALTYGPHTLHYAELQARVAAFASGLLALGLARTERVGIYLEKRFETVVARFGAPAAGGVMVPMNPLLKAEQVAFIARDCSVRVLVTSPERLLQLLPVLPEYTDLRHVVLTEGAAASVALPPGVALHGWAELMAAPAATGHRVIDTDLLV